MSTNVILKVIKGAVVFSIFFAAAFLAPHDADAKSTEPLLYPVPIIGKTDDGKYLRYDLLGDVEDVKWFTNTTNIVYSGGDLLDRLEYIRKEDVKSGVYKCKFVCMDSKGYIVGQPYWNKYIPRK
jgi:hypothetical protein